MLLIITSNSDKLYTAVNVDDLEPSKIKVFSDFFCDFRLWHTF